MKHAVDAVVDPAGPSSPSRGGAPVGTLAAAVMLLFYACGSTSDKPDGHPVGADGPLVVDAGQHAVDGPKADGAAARPDSGRDTGHLDASPLTLDSAAAAKPRMFLVKLDSKLRKKASATAGVAMLVRRGNRVKDIPPASLSSSFLEVTFLSKRGWLKRDRLKHIPAGTSRLNVAISYPNAFFKRQAYHPVWNPTGPSSSGNCAVASLAMAGMILRKEPPNIDVEKSIDRVRLMMNKPTDGGTASLAQVRLGAKKLGLSYLAMNKGGLDTQLGKRRMVVLAGQPGKSSSAPTVYQSAFIKAGYAYTYDGAHSILVIARIPSGKYLVADPLSRVGVIQLTKAQMKDFFARWGGVGTAVWIK